MKRMLFFSLIFIFSALTVCAQEVKKEEKAAVPEGMEIVKSGDVSVLVPKGTKVRYEGSLLVTESIGEYTGRKFSEVEERLKNEEAKADELNNKVEDLQKQVTMLMEKNQKLRQALEVLPVEQKKEEPK